MKGSILSDLLSRFMRITRGVQSEAPCDCLLIKHIDRNQQMKPVAVTFCGCHNSLAQEDDCDVLQDRGKENIAEYQLLDWVYDRVISNV